MGFIFSTEAEEILKSCAKKDAPKWSWDDYQIVVAGAGYELQKAKSKKIGKTKGSQQTYLLVPERINLGNKEAQFVTNAGYLTLSPHKPHPVKDPMASIAVETILAAIFSINLTFPEEEKQNDLISEELLSSRSLERIRQCISSSMQRNPGMFRR